MKGSLASTCLGAPFAGDDGRSGFDLGTWDGLHERHARPIGAAAPKAGYAGMAPERALPEGYLDALGAAPE